jgi:RNA polymerase sigma-70 factor (sigma-E family)
MTGSRTDAEDIAGEGLARAWEHWDRVRSADHPLAFVRKIIMNLSVDRVRLAIRERHRAALLAPMMSLVHQGPDVSAALDLHAAIVTLPPGRRACVVLRHIFDLPPEEVARTLGIRVGTVKSQTAKGLAQLREMLDEPRSGARTAGLSPRAGTPSRAGLSLTGRDHVHRRPSGKEQQHER